VGAHPAEHPAEARMMSTLAIIFFMRKIISRKAVFS
jgi:hypothetical protein